MKITPNKSKFEKHHLTATEMAGMEGAEVVFKGITIQSLTPDLKKSLDFENMFDHIFQPKNPIPLPKFDSP